MFKPSSCRYRTRPKMALEIHLQKTNAGPKGLSFLGQKIWSKIDLRVTCIHTYIHTYIHTSHFRFRSTFVFNKKETQICQFATNR